MCDLQSLNLPSSDFEKIPETIESDDPLLHVGKKDLVLALRTPAEHPWVADWLFKNSTALFHKKASTLTPEAFENALAVRIHHDIATPGPRCARTQPFLSIPQQSAQTTTTQQRPPKDVLSKDMDLLIVPFAKLKGITVGYAFIRNTILPTAGGTNSPFSGTSQNGFLCARFSFHHERNDMTIVVGGLPGEMVGVMSTSSMQDAGRHRTFFACPGGDYGAGKLPTRALMSQVNVDYEVPIPDSEPKNPTQKPHDKVDATSFHVLTNAPPKNIAAPSPTATATDRFPPFGNTVLPNSNSNLLINSMSPNSSGSFFSELATDNVLDYIHTQLYDGVVDETSDEQLERAINASSGQAPIDNLFQTTLSSGSSGSDSVLQSSSDDMHTSGEQSPYSFSSRRPRGDDIMVVDDENENEIGSMGDMSTPLFPSDGSYTDRDAQSRSQSPFESQRQQLKYQMQPQITGRPPTEGAWLTNHKWQAPDGIGMPRRAGSSDTSSGFFNFDLLSDALTNIENSIKGSFFGPKVTKDIMHPQTGELLSRCTGETTVHCSTQLDTNTVRYMRQIAAQSYFANLLPVSTDSRLISTSSYRYLTAPQHTANGTFATNDQTFPQAMPRADVQSQQKDKPTPPPPTSAASSAAHAPMTRLPPGAPAPTVVFNRVTAPPLAPRPMPGVTIAPRVVPNGAPPPGVPLVGANGAPGSKAVPIQPAAPVVKESTRESKLEAKRIKNRLSAAKSNQKRREQLEAQKKELALLRQRVEELKSRKQLVSAENESLRKKMSVESRTESKS